MRMSMSWRFALLMLVSLAAISTNASAGWNSYDWANLIRALTPPPPPVVIQRPPTVIIMPAPAAPVPPPAPTAPPAPVSLVPEVTRLERGPFDCEIKDYVQYKDEQKVLGNDVITAQMCQMMFKIRSGTDTTRAICSQELSKLALVRQAADAKSGAPAAEACFAAQWGVSVGMTQEQVKDRLAQRGVSPLETSTLKIAGKSTEQWRYETFSIYFNNTRVSAVQQYTNATTTSSATPVSQESVPIGVPSPADTPAPSGGPLAMLHRHSKKLLPLTKCARKRPARQASPSTCSARSDLPRVQAANAPSRR